MTVFWCHTYAHSHPNRGPEWTHKSLKKLSNFAEIIFFLRFNFQRRGHLYALRSLNCLFYILIIYRKSLLSQFSSFDIGIYISILTRVQKRRISSWKNDHILLKNVPLKLNFQDEYHLYAKFLFYILYVCLNCLLFQILSRGIRIHIPIKTGVEKGRITGWKNCHLLIKMYFWSLVS